MQFYAWVILCTFSNKHALFQDPCHRFLQIYIKGKSKDISPCRKTCTNTCVPVYTLAKSPVQAKLLLSTPQSTMQLYMPIRNLFVTTATLVTVTFVFITADKGTHVNSCSCTNLFRAWTAVLGQ